MADAAKTISLSAVPHAYVTCLPLPAVAAVEGGVAPHVGGHDVEFTPNCGCLAWPVWVGEDALLKDELLPALGEGTAADTGL
ncbi:hypothetical protein HaLaN_00014 [Haematococcus lacustris]|uniref:Uncharacterized protein n=1 Tax=Haematococcus lacustris TaxID=44745 RepID=A0A699Y863_HAELA|nr:hypothetical protein HaLaN_00014 [Haematococcus lacustris]